MADGSPFLWKSAHGQGLAAGTTEWVDAEVGLARRYRRPTGRSGLLLDSFELVSWLPATSSSALPQTIITYIQP